jgi:hypothetical protein
MRLSRGLAGLALLAGVAGVVATASAAPEMRLRGLLDLGLVSSVKGDSLNRLTFGDSNFDPYRLGLFLDARPSPNLELHAQTILYEGMNVIRADGAYALWTPWLGRDLSLEAGKIPWPIGTYAPRTYSDKNAFIGTPLIYQYRTSLAWATPALSVDQQVAKAGTGQFLQDPTQHPYLPVVDERWWDVGAVLLGSQRPLEFSLGVTQGSPSWPSPGPDNTPGNTYLGRLGLVPIPGVRVGVSGADGTWMPAWYSYVLPPGGDVRDYHETTLMADAEFLRGPFELRGEGVRRDWKTVKTGTLGVDGGYVEARWSFENGTWLAGRTETLRFSDVTTSAAVTRPWDDGVDRFEGVLGMRVTEAVRAKLAFQRTRRHPFSADVLQDDLVAGSLSIRF